MIYPAKFMSASVAVTVILLFIFVCWKVSNLPGENDITPEKGTPELQSLLDTTHGYYLSEISESGFRHFSNEVNNRTVEINDTFCLKKLIIPGSEVTEIFYTLLPLDSFKLSKNKETANTRTTYDKVVIRKIPI